MLRDCTCRDELFRPVWEDFPEIDRDALLLGKTFHKVLPDSKESKKGKNWYVCTGRLCSVELSSLLPSRIIWHWNFNLEDLG